MLVKVSVALAAPVTCGLNVTVNGALWPAGMVTGSESPLTLKTELFEFAAVTVTLEPLAFKLPEAVPLVPTTTLPTPNVVGVAVSWPAAPTPVPESGMVNVGLEAFEVIVTFPLSAAADGGVNDTLNVALWPAVSVTGAEIPLKLNPVPLTPTCEMVTLEPPEFVTVSDSVCLVFTVTLPKPRLVGFDPNAPTAIPVPDRDIVNVGFDASELMVTLPAALPVVVGAKLAVKVVLWEAFRVSGVVIPVS